MIKDLFEAHRRIVFNGNGYTQEWVEEAERRGLPNLRCMVDAIPALVTDKAVKLFTSFGVYTEAELFARAVIEYEAYVKTINVEAKTMLDMAGKQIVPAVIRYTTFMAQSINTIQKACSYADVSVQTDMLMEMSKLLGEMKAAMNELEKTLEMGNHFKDMEQCAHYYYDAVVPAMNHLREPADLLEMLVDKSYWPFPSYGDMIFEV